MKQNFSRRAIIGGIAAALSTAAMLPAKGDTRSLFAGKTIRLVTEYPAGSGPDLVGRLIAPRLSEMLGGSFLVEPRAGAGGRIAARAVASAPADGSTLLLMTAAQTVIAVTDPDIPYNVLNDFQFVSMLVEYPFFIFTSATSDYNSLSALLDAARKTPGKITYASPGVGTTTHLAMEMLAKQAGVTMVHVPYAASQMVPDVQTNVVSSAVGNLAAIKGLLDAGNLRALAVTSKDRDPLTQTVPAVSESVPGYDVTTWLALAAPSGTPRPLVDGLHEAVRKIMGEPEIRERLSIVGFTPVTNKPEEMRARVASDIAKWTPFGTVRP
jgi:tripartite-type tricarboxylate transporter receptor subunit TctC